MPMKMNKSAKSSGGSEVKPRDIQRKLLALFFRDQKGYLRLSRRDKSITSGFNFHQVFHHYPDKLEDALNQVAEWDNQELDVYFTPHLYSEPQAIKQFALSGRVAWADLDDCLPEKLGKYEEPPPTFIVQSSRAHAQAYWLFSDPIETYIISELNHRIYEAYKDEGCDACWAITHPMRMPYTHNYKRDESYLITMSPIPTSRFASKQSFVTVPDLDRRLPRIGSIKTRIPTLDYDNMSCHRPIDDLSVEGQLIWWEEPKEGERSEFVFRLARYLKQTHLAGDGLIIKTLMLHPILEDKWPNPERRRQDIERCLFKLRGAI